MGIHQNSPLIDVAEVRKLHALTGDALVTKQANDEALAKIIKGEDKRLLLVIGPCSSDNEEAVLDYAHRLAKLQEEVKDKIFIVMRVYTAKPRTNGDGYKGLIHQPDAEGEVDLLTGVKEMIGEIAQLMCYEATRDLKLTDVEIDTPICHATVKELKGKKLAVVPILRAGLGMVDGMLAMIPAAKVGHIGLYRDPETLEPVEYYCKLPDDCANREVFVVDPMLATGGSSAAAIQMLKDKGVKNIHLMVIIAAPEGVKKMQEAHPDVDIYIGALDDHLNEHGYIVPGLGDAGDRIFGTK